MDTMHDPMQSTVLAPAQQFMHTAEADPGGPSTFPSSPHDENLAVPGLVHDHGHDSALPDTGEADAQHANGQDGDLNLEDYVGDGQTKYHLRQSARELKSSFSRTWLDDDKTGSYDPADEQRKLRQRPKRRICRPKAFTPWDLNESDEESEPRKERPQKERPRLDVTLSFKSEPGRASFERHVNSLPAPSEPSEELFCERRLRRRDSGVKFAHAFSAGPTKKKELPDDLPDDLTGHPIARGCWECVSIGIRCPLLDDPRAWPCATCQDDGNECELIIPPTYKRACEHCKSKRLGCSYTFTLDHDGPCEECSRTGWACVAGPAKEAIRERISYDRDWENDPWQAPKPPKLKKLPSCRRCREHGQPCSFSAGDKGEVCTACDMASKTCLPELGTTQASRKRKRAQISSKTAAAEDNAEAHKIPDVLRQGIDDSGHIVIGESSDDAEAEAPVAPKPAQIYISSGSSDSDSDIPLPPKKTKPSTQPGIQAKQKEEGTLETITTKFAHPIAFNYTGDEPCHFCTDPRFPMFGLGPVDVEVIVWHDGRGLQETGGGHRGRGIERTRMCVECTTARTPIVTCEGHVLRSLGAEGFNAATASNHLALARLLNGTSTGKERWCSICPALAAYECCTAGPQGSGCGLLLCEACMVAVVSCDGDLERALEQLQDEEGEERLLGLRADAEFLSTNGLLMRFVVWESEQSAPE